MKVNEPRSILESLGSWFSVAWPVLEGLEIRLGALLADVQ